MMNKKRRMDLFKVLLVVFLLTGFLCSESFSSSVTSVEALAVADLWYTREVNSGFVGLSQEDRGVRSEALNRHELHYLYSGGRLLTTPLRAEKALAYVVCYHPAGYVVVAGDDRIEPVIAFSVKFNYRWDEPENNFFRKFLEKEMPKRWAHVDSGTRKSVGVHPNWEKLRFLLNAGGIQSDQLLRREDPPAGTTYLLLDTALWDQGGFYNDTVTAHNGNIDGIPVGCTATAMAIKMRFHSWPGRGSGSHSYTDRWGDVRYAHFVNFGSSTYTWSAMPTEDLTAANSHVANLMYQCGVAVDMNYEVGVSRAWPSADAMNNFFGYRGTYEYNNDSDPDAHINGVRDSILAHLPVVICSHSHTVVACGYRDTESPYYFYLNCGRHGYGNAWYNLDDICASDPTIDRSYPYGAPSNYVFVDKNTFMPSTLQNGTLFSPYKDFIKGCDMVPADGHVWVRAGNYPVDSSLPLTLDKSMTLHTYRGAVTIGE